MLVLRAVGMHRRYKVCGLAQVTHPAAHLVVAGNILTWLPTYIKRSLHSAVYRFLVCKPCVCLGMQVGAPHSPSPGQWVPPSKIARGQVQPKQEPQNHRGKGSSDSREAFAHLGMFDEAVVSCVGNLGLPHAPAA